MDQRQIVKKLEEHFRKEDEKLHGHRKRVHEERESLTDEEWWDELIERTASIRPQMVEIFERNKGEMIAKRFQTVNSEEDYREKVIQRRVMDLLPHISAVRSDTGDTGEVTLVQIQLAMVRQSANAVQSKESKIEYVQDPNQDGAQTDLIENLIELQLRRQAERN